MLGVQVGKSVSCKKLNNTSTDLRKNSLVCAIGPRRSPGVEKFDLKLESFYRLTIDTIRSSPVSTIETLSFFPTADPGGY